MYLVLFFKVDTSSDVFRECGQATDTEVSSVHHVNFSCDITRYSAPVCPIHSSLQCSRHLSD